MRRPSRNVLTQDKAKLVIGNREESLLIKGETDKTWQKVDEAVKELTFFHQEGTNETEKLIELSTKVQSYCEHLRDTYQTLKSTFQELQTAYKEVGDLAQEASKTPHRNQVKRELEEIAAQDPEKKIPDLVGRYQKHGRSAGDSGVTGYRTTLENLKRTLQNFLENQEKLEKLQHLQQSAERFIQQIGGHLQALNDLDISVEVVERLDNVPQFCRIVLSALQEQSQIILDNVRNYQSKFTFSIQDDDLNSLNTQLSQLEGELLQYEEDRNNFKEEIRQFDYRLKSILMPRSFYHLEETYKKFLEDFRFELQKKMQEVYQEKTYQDAVEGHQDVSAYVDQVEECITKISDLDNWF
jgi:hypothetical protein